MRPEPLMIGIAGALSNFQTAFFTGNFTAGANVSLAIVGGKLQISASGGDGTGDFMADGTVPMTGNLDTGGNSVINTLAVDMTDGSVFNGNTWVGGSTVSSISLMVDTGFGIHNGEEAGVGADINFVSVNGAVKVSGTSLQVIGGIVTPYREVSADYTVVATDHIIRDITDSGSITITLPDPTATPVGQEIIVICSNTDSGDTLIGGTATIGDVSGGSATFYNNGTTWVAVVNLI